MKKLRYILPDSIQNQLIYSADKISESPASRIAKHDTLWNLPQAVPDYISNIQLIYRITKVTIAS